MTLPIIRRIAAASVVLAVVLGSAAPARADSVRDRQWYWTPLNVAQAHRISQGGGVTVAVLDSGVDGRHRDLGGAVQAGRQVVQNKPAGNLDTIGHGTGMAGLIAGRGHGDDAGVLGIAPQAKIMPITPANDTFFVGQGIRWAAEHGADVIVLAFGINDGEGLRAAVREAAANDVVLIGTAGNTGDQGNEVEYPGAYPEVLTVGAVDRRNKIAKFSNHGPHIDLTAPGVDLPAPAPGNKYVTATGSSGAAGIVAGAAALIRAKYPDLPATEVVERLTDTAIDRGDPGRDDYYGAGQLNLLAALSPPPPVSEAATPAGAAPVGAPDVAEDEGIPPLVFVGVGVAVLLVATAVGGDLAARTRGVGS